MSHLNERFLSFLDEERPAHGTHSLAVTYFLVSALLLAIALLLLVLGSRPSATLGLGIGLAAVAIASAALGFFRLIRLRQTRWQAKRLRDIVARGERVNAYLVRADDGLYRPGTKTLPCQVLISFQSEVSGDSGYMQHLAQRWAEQTSPAERKARYRRRKLPLSLTDGSCIYCCDLLVAPALLANGTLNGSVLPCMAEYGDEGGIELVPYWLLFPYTDALRVQRQRV